MNKTLQEQYNLIKEGKGSKEHFMRTVRHTFPDLITPTLSYNDTVTVLKNKSIISEGIGGIVTTGKKQDWHNIFKENMANLKEEKEAKVGDTLKHKSTGAEFKITKISGNDIEGKYTKLGGMEGKVKVGDTNKTNKNLIGKTYKLISEAKAVEKETTKDVTDMATRGYDYKDEKNWDNVFGQEFLKGYYTEMKDPKNEGKNVNELKAIVAKNLAKDVNHYVKDGQFGVKGIGYTTEAPGLGTPKEAKGKHKSSGYGDLKESVLRAFISETIKEVLAETKKKPSAGLTKKEKSTISKKAHAGKDIGKKGKGFEKVAKTAAKQYGSKEAGEKVAAAAMWKHLAKESLTPEDKVAFSKAAMFAEKLYNKLGNVEDVIANLPKPYIRFKNELEQHLIQKFEG